MAAGMLGQSRPAGPGSRGAAGGLDDHIGGGLGRAVGGLGHDGDVGVGDGDDAGVAEHVLDDLQVRARGQRQRGGTVTQVVQPDRRQVTLPDQGVEPVGEVLGANRPSVGVGEHCPSRAPAGSGAGAGVGVALVAELVPEQLDSLPDRLEPGRPCARS